MSCACSAGAGPCRSPSTCLPPLDRSGDRKQLAHEAREAIAQTLGFKSRGPLAYSRERMTPKTFKIKSFGCQMNVYDGERMAELLGRSRA